MKVTRRPLLGWCPSVEPVVVRLELTASETRRLRDAAKLLGAIANLIHTECGEDTAYRDPWVDLSLGASAINDILDDPEIS